MGSRLECALLILLAWFPAWAQGVRPIAYRNTDPKVAYVGSKSCAASGCHEEICRRYLQTPMGHSMAPANAPSELAKVPQLITVFNSKVDRYFEVYRDGSDLYQSEYQLGEDGQTVFRTTHRLDYVVGAGQTGYTYLFRRGQWLFEAPLSYYSETKRWEMSPGYEAKDFGFTRPIPVTCLACHNGQPVPVPQRDGMYADPISRFGELGLSCECCHGPGALHVQEMEKRHRRSSSHVDTSIVNPARLPPSLANNICMICHQFGDAVVFQQGKSYLDFRPGTSLYETMVIFKRPLSKERRAEADRLETLPPVRGSLETPLWWKNSSLTLSKCYQASQGRLRCISCHAIHDPPTPRNQVEYFRAKCLACHADADCKLPSVQRMRRQPANDCVGCHMEKRAVAGIAHTSDTKHRIVRRPGQPLPEIAFEQPTPDLPGLLYLNKAEDEAGDSLPLITKLAAYEQAMRRDPNLQKYYEQFLEQLSKSEPEDPSVLVRLGMKALMKDDDAARAADYFSRALQRGSDDPSTFLYLAEALSRTSRTQQAAQLLERGVAIYPYEPALRASLALEYIRLNQDERAIEVIRRHMELFPEDPVMRGLLKKIGLDEPLK